MDALFCHWMWLLGNATSSLRFQEILCQLESFKTAQVARQIQYDDTIVSAQLKRKERQPRGAPLVLFTLCLNSSFGMLWLKHTDVRTHVTGPSPVLTMQLKEQQITDCTIITSVCACVRALMCSHVWLRPHVPRHIQEMFWKQGAEQLNAAKDSVQENVCERVSGGWKKTLRGPDGQITWDWVIWRERGKSSRSLGQENCDHLRDD